MYNGLLYIFMIHKRVSPHTMQWWWRMVCVLLFCCSLWTPPIIQLSYEMRKKSTQIQYKLHDKQFYSAHTYFEYHKVNIFCFMFINLSNGMLIWWSIILWYRSRYKVKIQHKNYIFFYIKIHKIDCCICKGWSGNKQRQQLWLRLWIDCCSFFQKKIISSWYDLCQWCYYCGIYWIVLHCFAWWWWEHDNNVGCSEQ